MTQIQRERINELKRKLFEKPKKQKVLVEKIIKELDIINKELFQYVNCWAELRHQPYAHKAGIRTTWGDGYKQACSDIYNKLELLKVKNIQRNYKYNEKIAVRCSTCQKYLGTNINEKYNILNGCIQRGQGRNRPFLTFCDRECLEFFKEKSKILNPVFVKDEEGGK